MWSKYPLITLCLSVGLFLVCITLAAGAIAGLAGCQLNEAGIHACQIMGSDWGLLLYNMQGAFVFGILALMMAFLGTIGRGIVAIIRSGAR